MSVHFIVCFEPKPGNEAAFREALFRVAEPSRTEPGCRDFRVFESLCQPPSFAIHSEWADEAAFELHAGLPHTLQFLRSAEELLTHDVQGLRSREIAEGVEAHPSS